MRNKSTSRKIEYSAVAIGETSRCPFMFNQEVAEPEFCIEGQCPMAIIGDYDYYCSFAVKSLMLVNLPRIHDSLEGIAFDLSTLGEGDR